MTKAKRRRVEIINLLSEMSRDWSRWSAADWKPLELELAKTPKPVSSKIYSSMISERNSR